MKPNLIFQWLLKSSLTLVWILGLLGALYITEVLQSRTPRKQKQNSYTTLLFAGDTHFSWGVAELQKTEGLLAPVESVHNIFAKVDFRVLNLETVLSKIGFPMKEKSYIFHSSVKNLDLLRYLRIDLAILGNNHSMDMGEAGLKDMIHILAEANIGQVGAGNNEKQAMRPYYYTKGKQKFVFLSANRVGIRNVFSNTNKAGVTAKLADLSQFSKENTIIVSLHWGVEYFLYPSKEQIKFARSLIDAGASVIIGHHPHIPQAVEIYKKGVIFYSLGNFLFGSANDRQKDNILALLDYNQKQSKLKRIRIVPINGRYRQRGHRIRLLSTPKEINNFWQDYFWRIQKHSPSTAKKLRIRNDGVGVILL